MKILFFLPLRVAGSILIQKDLGSGTWDTIQTSLKKAGIWSPRFKEECIIEKLALKEIIHSSTKPLNSSPDSTKLFVSNTTQKKTFEDSPQDPPLRKSQEVTIQFNQTSTQIVGLPQTISTFTQTQFSLNQSDNSQILYQILSRIESFEEKLDDLQNCKPSKKTRSLIPTTGGTVLTSTEIENHLLKRSEKKIQTDLKKLEKQKREKQLQLDGIQNKKKLSNYQM